MLLRSAIVVLLSVPSIGAAQDNGIAFDLGVGASVRPEYFGAEDSTVRPTGSFDLERLELGPISRTSTGRSLGFKPSVSTRFISERDASEYDELDGLDDVDFSVELGGGVKYAAPNYEVFAHLRYGVIGHESLVGEFGGDVLYEATDRITLSAGPRILWGSDDYAETYFGVSDGSTVYDSFEASSGIVSAGVKAEARYEFNDNWGITGSVSYDQLREDAADSPISQSDDQLSGSLVITRRISFGF